jgi:hypothetical protein
MAVFAVLILGPWMVRNFIAFGKFIPFGSALPIQFWLGNNPEAETDPYVALYRRFPTFNETERLLILELGEIRYGELAVRRFQAFATRQPWRYVRLVAERVLWFWTFTPHTRTHWHVEARARLALFLLYLTAATGLLAARRPRHWNWFERTILLFLALYPLVHYFTHFNVYRYRIPLEILLVALVASAAAGLLDASDGRPEIPTPAPGGQP